ncbi:MAG: hypothetical protein ABI613_03245 [Gemmatimonadota bacterium]
MTSTWKASLLLGAAFVVGALSGGTAIGLAERRGSGSGDHDHHHHDSGDHVEFLVKELKLTVSQRDSVQAILDRYRPKMDSIWRQLGPRFETIKDSISTDIRRQLTAEQQKTYTEMIRRLDADHSGAKD